MTTAQRLGMTFLTYLNICLDGQHSGRQRCQRQELAEHTVVRPRRHRGHMPVATVVNTVGTLGLAYRCSCFVHMNRRQQEHWQEYCQ